MIKIFFINTLIAAIIAYTAILLYVAINQRKLLYLPRQSKIKITPKTIGIKYENHYMKISDKEIVNLWLIPANKQTKETLIYFHGNAGNLEDRVDLIPPLQKLGLNLVFFDYRGYGESIGSPTEQNLYEDAEAVISFIKERLNIKDKDLIFLGKSLGGAVAIELAKRHPEIKALIIDSTFTSLPEIASEYYPFLPCKWFALDRFNNKEKISLIPCPKLFLHSKQDRVVRYKHSLILFERAREPKKLILFEFGSHDNLLLENEEEYIKAVKEFLDSSKSEENNPTPATT